MYSQFCEFDNIREINLSYAGQSVGCSILIEINDVALFLYCISRYVLGCSAFRSVLKCYLNCKINKQFLKKKLLQTSSQNLWINVVSISMSTLHFVKKLGFVHVCDLVTCDTFGRFYLSNQAKRLLAAPIRSTTDVRKSLGNLRLVLPS